MSTLTQPIFPRLKDLAHMSVNDSATSLCSEAEREEFSMTFAGTPPVRQSSSLSTASAPSASANAKRKKKAALWAEKYETTAVVFGPLETHELFKELVEAIRETIGEIKSDYFRQEQFCGFVYFYNEDSADDCKHRYNGIAFQGQIIHACSPSQFFKNEEEAFPDPGRKRNLTPQTSNVSTINTSISEPTTTLVIKNLCFGLKQERLLDFMAGLGTPPQSVSYHYDSNGLFRGVAFAKYQSPEAASESFKELQGIELGGRKIRVEFKRRTNNIPNGPVRQQSFDSSMLSPMRNRPNATTSNISQEMGNPSLAKIATNLVKSEPPAQINLSPPDKPRERVEITAKSTREPSPEQTSQVRLSPPNLSPIPPKKSPVVIREGMEFEGIEAPVIMHNSEKPPPPTTSLKLSTDVKSRPVLRAHMEFSS